MSADIFTWLQHPVTFTLGGLGIITLLIVSETLSRSLAAVGNVRFQGMLHDHPKLFSFAGENDLGLSSLLDVLRWLQITIVGLLWLTIIHFPGWTWQQIAPASFLIPLISIFISRRIAHGLGEDSIARLLRWTKPLTTPLVKLTFLGGSNPPIPPPEDEEEEASEREIQAFLDVGQAAGIIEGEEGEILESLVEFFDTTVKEVMTPRTEMIAVGDEVGFEQLFDAVVKTHKSRIPVYHETVDNIVGVAHVKNLVEGLKTGDRPPIKDLMRECLVVPESKKLGELLRDFQQHQQQMAIVVDEYGGTSGLVTLEDILEEIVGEIQDEHDPSPQPEYREVSPGVYRLRGRAPLELLEELFDLDLEEEEMETVGGLVFDRHGTVPAPGTEVDDETHGLHFTVEEMRERRIAVVSVQKKGKS